MHENSARKAGEENKEETLGFELKSGADEIDDFTYRIYSEIKAISYYLFLPNALHCLLPFPRKYRGLLKPDYFYYVTGIKQGKNKAILQGFQCTV